MYILLYMKEINSEKSKVVGINHNPYHPITGVSQEVIETNILVDNIPESNNILGKTAIHYINPITKGQWFEYMDRPLTLEEQLQQDLGNVLFENAMDKARIAELELQQGEMLMEIAMLKMGGSH